MAAASIPFHTKVAKYFFATGQLRFRAFRKGLAKVTFYSVSHLFLVGGCASIAYGAWMIYHPLGPICGGWFAIRIARLWADDDLER